jgi:hypothetical protein
MLYYLVLLALSSLATSSFTLPPNAVDGVYTHEVSESTGEVTVWYHGPIDEAAAQKRSPIKLDFVHPTVNLARQVEKLKARAQEGTNCPPSDDNGWFINVSDAMIQRCGGGYEWKNSISILKGNAIAYGCDYGKGQKCYADTVYKECFKKLDDACGKRRAGWYSKPKWKVSYGRVEQGNSFC